MDDLSFGLGDRGRYPTQSNTAVDALKYDKENRRA